MQFALDLMQKIPAGWPRWATLAAIVIVYFFFPTIAKQLIGGRQEKETLDRITRFLQVKKLLLELEALQKEKDLAGAMFAGEARLLAELQESATAVEQSPETIPYISRLQYSLLGGAVFFLFTALLFVFGSFPATTAWGTATFLLRDLGLTAGCGLLASFIPLGTLRASFIYGLTMPLALALLVLIVTR
jgi:hypothetical protein